MPNSIRTPRQDVKKILQDHSNLDGSIDPRSFEDIALALSDYYGARVDEEKIKKGD